MIRALHTVPRHTTRSLAAALLAAALLGAATGGSAAFATTTDELAELLGKARLPEAEMVASSTGTVEESSLDFLGGTYLRVTLEGPLGPEILHFVRQRSRLIPIARGQEGRQRVASELEVSVRSPDASLRYVRWLLEVTRKGSFQLVASADDVRFLPTTLGEDDLQARIETARLDLESKIEPPRAEEAGAVFIVHQDAIAGRDLVRLTVRVSKLGLPMIEVTPLASGLPVVDVATD